jgi:catechol 2,3-dioxygenase-like lactoylglutathione lyase family enzyme
VEEAIPVLRVDEAVASVPWYRRLGYVQEWEHRFEPGFPAFVSVVRDGGSRLFLSEHTGDATPNALVYLRVNNLDAVAQEFGSEVLEQPWGREVHLVDPDGNRLRVGEPAPNE